MFTRARGRVLARRLYAAPQAMRVAIVGAGFSGTGMGVALQRSGHDYTLFERSGDVGGVRHHNTCPGAACDVPSCVHS